MEKSGIKRFTDVKGKTISTWFTGPQFMLQAMLRANHIEPRDVKIEAQAASMVPFLEGKVDMAIVTVYNEALVLKRRGVTPAAVFNPADMGVNIPNKSLIVNERVVKENPKLVQGFLNATLRGWAYALAHQDEAIDAMLASRAQCRSCGAEGAAARRSCRSFSMAMPRSTKGIGYIDPQQLAVHESLPGGERRAEVAGRRAGGDQHDLLGQGARPTVDREGRSTEPASAAPRETAP